MDPMNEDEDYLQPDTEGLFLLDEEEVPYSYFDIPIVSDVVKKDDGQMYEVVERPAYYRVGERKDYPADVFSTAAEFEEARLQDADFVPAIKYTKRLPSAEEKQVLKLNKMTPEETFQYNRIRADLTRLTPEYREKKRVEALVKQRSVEKQERRKRAKEQQDAFKAKEKVRERRKWRAKQQREAFQNKIAAEKFWGFDQNPVIANYPPQYDHKRNDAVQNPRNRIKPKLNYREFPIYYDWGPSYAGIDSLIQNF